jgi:uncharacterized membrane protein YdjX (TVP38/TMEM64 family)
MLVRRLLPVVVLGLIAIAFVVGRGVREGLAVDPSPAGLQAWIAGLGWKGPAAFLTVLTFRQFLLLPSAVLLTAGGLCFGVAAGTALGGAGVALSAAMKFFLARLAAREWIERRTGARSRALAARVERLGPLVVGVATAHPAGPLSPFHWGAGLSSMAPVAFLVAVLLAAPVRAFVFSLLGSTLLDVRSPDFLVASAVLLVVALGPLVHPGVRRWLFGRP